MSNKKKDLSDGPNQNWQRQPKKIKNYDITFMPDDFLTA